MPSSPRPTPSKEAAPERERPAPIRFKDWASI